MRAWFLRVRQKGCAGVAGGLLCCSSCQCVTALLYETGSLLFMRPLFLITSQSGPFLASVLLPSTRRLSFFFLVHPPLGILNNHPRTDPSDRLRVSFHPCYPIICKSATTTFHQKLASAAQKSVHHPLFPLLGLRPRSHRARSLDHNPPSSSLQPTELPRGNYLLLDPVCFQAQNRLPKKTDRPPKRFYTPTHQTIIHSPPFPLFLPATSLSPSSPSPPPLSWLSL